MISTIFKSHGQNVKKITLALIGSVVLIGGIGFGTIELLKQLKAPTATHTNTQHAQTTQTKPAATPAEAVVIADKAKATALDKVAKGDQAGALKEYQIAHDNYKIANNATETMNTQFAIDSIKAVLAVPPNPGKPTGGKVGAK